MKMKVLLLHVTSFTLERLVARTSVNQHFTADNTHGHTSCKDIQKRGFTGTRDTLFKLLALESNLFKDKNSRSYHQSSASTRFHPSIYIVQNAPRFVLDLDVIADILPVEDGSLSLNIGNVLV